uniref:Heterogeneous nuclear ribonucleoprotein Q acidic domain-containing protein n=1 Tax=Chelonoidis abingdonii TaxID=106734 RepID=A0A8C0IKF1_CHEAB
MATEHVNGSGTKEPMDTSATFTHSKHFQILLVAGLQLQVAEKLDGVYLVGLAAHSDLDKRPIDVVKEFNKEGLLAAHQPFKDPNVSHVQNNSAFFMSRRHMQR